MVRAALRGLAAGELPWPLFLHGKVGRGKSCLGLALTDHVPGSLYYTVTQLNDAVMRGWKAGGFDWDKLGPVTKREHHSPTGCPLLVIDELGTRNTVTDAAYEILQTAVDYRESSPLVLITNHTLDGIEDVYDDRIKDRCQQGTIVEWIGPDLRAV